MKNWLMLPNTLGDRVSGYIDTESIPVMRGYKKADCIISNKLHTTIVAASYGRRVISVAKHPKNQRFFEDIGRSDLYLKHDCFDEKKFVSLIHLLKNGQLEPIILSDLVCDRARKNYELISDFLKIL